MKKYGYSILLIALSFIICSYAPQAKEGDTVKPEQEGVITKEIQHVMDQMISGINNFNADLVFKNIDQLNFAGFINEGTILNYISAYSAIKDFYSQIKNVQNEISEKNYVVLSGNSALFSCKFKEEITFLNNEVGNFEGAMSCVLIKTNDEWKVIQIHQSVVQGNN